MVSIQVSAWIEFFVAYFHIITSLMVFYSINNLKELGLILDIQIITGLIFSLSQFIIRYSLLRGTVIGGSMRDGQLIVTIDNMTMKELMTLLWVNITNILMLIVTYITKNKYIIYTNTAWSIIMITKMLIGLARMEENARMQEADAQIMGEALTFMQYEELDITGGSESDEEGESSKMRRKFDDDLLFELDEDSD